jgi:sn-glycerol 3-phosphate transport system substrate-binding protein
MRRTFWSALSLLVVLSMLLAGCAQPAQQPAATQAPVAQPAATEAPAAAPAATEAPAAAPAATQAPAAAAPTNTPLPTPTGAPVPQGAVQLSFWHSMGGDIGGKAIPQLATDFNLSQQECYVTPTYQGSYDDSLNKLKAGLQSKDIPAVVQLFDIGSRLMIDLQVATPVQDFIDAEGYDVSDLETNVLAYYTVDGQQWSMPFNTSNPMLYYNKDMFRDAGLDPDNPPRTWAEFEDAARKLTQKDASGKVTMPGAVFAIYGWFFEQFLAVSGGYYADNENGRAAPATAATFNSPEGVAILEWWKKMHDEGIMGNLGRRTVDVRNAFMAEQTAMIIESTATLRGMMDAAEGKFEIGTAFLPRPTEEAYDKSGTIIGGASVWILKDRPAEEQQCAWEFVKFVSAPPQQAYWQTMSGYYPIRKAAYEEPIAKEWTAKYPQFATAIEQLHIAPNNRFTQGGLIGVFPTARQTIEGAIEEVLAGAATPQEALDKAAQSITEAIEEYNITMGIN